jgi:sulfoxide reductase catalytic subunit YedY
MTVLIKRQPGWGLPEASATPESAYLSRRALLRGMAAGTAAGLLPASPAHAATGADLYPFPRNETYTVKRALTDEVQVTTYNNFYEFGSHKKIYKAAQKLKTEPWAIEIDGLVEEPFTIDIEDLLRRMPRDERLYRHRCVEAWSMIVPWSGFPLKALVELARPLSHATHIRFESFHNKYWAPGQRLTVFPWPYTEGLTLAEATNDMAYMATGLYGKPLEKQNGAPFRLVVPWKYGFKSIKSIVKITFTDHQPATFWNTINDELYGFWANVNPDVPFPDWSQATEKLLGTGKNIATRLYNGYGEHVAHLYDGMDNRRIYF